MSREERRRYRNELDFLHGSLTIALQKLADAQEQNRKLHRQVAALAGHPCSQNGWMSGAQFIGGSRIGGDDETLAEIRWQA